jgi:predicted site-specific integrase-resolvase
VDKQNLIASEYFSEEEICSILKISRATLRSRIYSGTEHPPYVELGRVRYFPRRMFLDWAAKRRVIWAVHDAS